MSGNFSFGRVDLSADARPAPAPRSDRLGGPPFRIGVLADFSGGRRADAGGPVVPVDRDRFDALMARLSPGLTLSWPGRETDTPPLTFTFRSLDDFDPDHLLATEAFRPLRDARRRLADPATFRATAEQLGLLAPPAQAPAPPPPPVDPGGPSLLDQVLAQTPTRPVEDRAWRSYLDRITAPHVQAGRDPRQDELVAGVDAVLSQRLRDLLHHPAFQALEAAWRGLDRLTRELETGDDLTIDLIDVSRAALEADLVSTTPLDRTATFRRLVDDTAEVDEARPWDLLVADLTFEPTERDAALFWRLGQIARLARAPLIASASPRWLGCRSLAETPDPDDWSPPRVDAWADLRRADEAPYLGLVLPRVVLRLPYGSETVPIDTFRFEELGPSPDHEHYLWGPPALVVALLIGRAVNQGGRDWGPAYDPELGDLPLPLVSTESGSTALPCAEVLLGQRAVDWVLDAGLMPLVSLRNRDAVRLAQLRSISDPPAALALRGP